MITIAKQVYGLGNAYRVCNRVLIDGEDFQTVKRAAPTWKTSFAPKPGTDDIPF